MRTWEDGHEFRRSEQTQMNQIWDIQAVGFRLGTGASFPAISVEGLGKRGEWIDLVSSPLRIPIFCLLPLPVQRHDSASTGVSCLSIEPLHPPPPRAGVPVCSPLLEREISLMHSRSMAISLSQYRRRTFLSDIQLHFIQP